MRIVNLSDTHGNHQSVKVPDGDILIHAGDFTLSGDDKDVISFNEWLGTLPHKYKVCIAGNHDLLLERHYSSRELITNAIYLHDSSIVLDGISIYGTPYQVEFNDWAFGLPRGSLELKAKRDAIPPDTDIVVTHDPPYLIGDLTSGGVHTGCYDLYYRLYKIKPKLHIFGHIHTGYGIHQQGWGKCINASICNDWNEIENSPIVIDI